MSSKLTALPEQGQRYTSLTDVFAVARRRITVIVALTTMCAASAYGFSTARATKYTAESAVSYADPSEDLSILGVVGARGSEPDQLAAAKADTITRPELLEDLRNRLGLQLRTDDLAKRFDASVEATSNLVVISATAPAAVEAARLANGLANTSVAAESRDARGRYRTAALGIGRRLARLGASRGDSAARLGLQDQLTRLESLSTLAQPASVAKTAQVPDGPSSPKPVRNGIIAGFFGLFLGLGIASFREALDRRLHGSVEIEDLGLPVLASVSQDAMGKVARIDGVPGRENAAAMESIRVLRTSLTLLEPEPRVVAVTSALPQEGKSTVSAALACTNEASGRSTLLLECDLRRPSLADRLSIRPSPGLTDYMSNTATLDEILQTVSVAEGGRAKDGRPNTRGDVGNSAVSDRRLTCIMAGSSIPFPSEMLADRAFATLLDELRSSFEVIIIDTSPLLPVADTTQLLPMVDGVVLCVRVGQTTRDQALAGKAALDRVSKEKPIGVVATGVTEHDRAAYGYYAYEPSRVLRRPG